MDRGRFLCCLRPNLLLPSFRILFSLHVQRGNEEHFTVMFDSFFTHHISCSLPISVALSRLLDLDPIPRLPWMAQSVLGLHGVLLVLIFVAPAAAEVCSTCLNANGNFCGANTVLPSNLQVSFTGSCTTGGLFGPSPTSVATAACCGKLAPGRENHRERKRGREREEQGTETER